MADTPERAITVLLAEYRKGKPEAEAKLFPLVYEQLRSLARKRMSRERANHTLRPTELVNEAYLRMQSAEIDFHDRSHFYAVAAQVMRRILCDHARARLSGKRGGGLEKISLEDTSQFAVDRPEHLVDLDEAMDRLSTWSPRQSKVVEMHVFGGLTFDEIGEVMEISGRTVMRDWNVARAWLYRHLKKGQE